MPLIARPTFTMYYDDRGPRDAPVVVLMHSLLCDGSMFAHLCDSLAADHRVLNVDLRGHGQSTRPAESWSLEEQADDVIALLDSLGIARAALVGLSQGGMTALRVAFFHPLRVSAMVVMSSSADPEERWNRVKYLAMATSVRFIGLTDLVANAVAPLMFSEGFLRARPEVIAEHKARWRAMDRMSAYGGTHAVAMRSDAAPMLRDIRCPTLVVAGEHDRAQPVFRSRRIVEGIHGAMLVTIPRAGHLSTIEQPEETTRVVRGWLSQQKL